MEINNNDRIALENFLLDVGSLEIIENIVNKFNVFDVLKASTNELRHSNVLAWLLNPNENHNLGDLFLKKFIQNCTSLINTSDKSKEISTIEASLMDYYDFIIKREWNNIDILILSEENKLVLCIENKVLSRESKNQLNKYLNIINTEYPNYRKLFLFLTPLGDAPSDQNNWNIITYEDILSILVNTMKLKKDNLNKSVELFLNQYKEVIERDVTMNNNLPKICTEIYYKHQKALDLIFEYKPDIYFEISKILCEELSKHDNIILDISNKTYIRFLNTELDLLIPKLGKKWTSTNRILLYEFQNRNNNKLTFKLIIGPTSENHQNIRQNIFNIVQNSKDIFKKSSNKFTSEYTTIYSTTVLSKDEIEGQDITSMKEKISTFITNFIDRDMRKINDEIISNLKNIIEN